MASESKAAQSPELSALSNNIALLSDGITDVSTVTHFALLLEEGGFITSDKNRRIRQILGIDEHEKCAHLLDAVKQQVKMNPAKFNAFIDLLNREPALQIYADKLTESHGEWYIYSSSVISYYHTEEAKKCAPGPAPPGSKVGLMSCHFTTIIPLAFCCALLLLCCLAFLHIPACVSATVEAEEGREGSKDCSAPGAGEAAGY